jgi:hypothetical protein
MTYATTKQWQLDTQVTTFAKRMMMKKKNNHEDKIVIDGVQTTMQQLSQHKDDNNNWMMMQWFFPWQQWGHRQMTAKMRLPSTTQLRNNDLEQRQIVKQPRSQDQQWQQQQLNNQGTTSTMTMTTKCNNMRRRTTTDFCQYCQQWQHKRKEDNGDPQQLLGSAPQELARNNKVNNNMKAFIEALAASKTISKWIDTLIEEVNASVLLLGQKNLVQQTHSWTKFGRTRSCPNISITCLIGTGPWANAVIIDHNQAAPSTTISIPSKTYIAACKTVQDPRNLAINATATTPNMATVTTTATVSTPLHAPGTTTAAATTTATTTPPRRASTCWLPNTRPATTAITHQTTTRPNIQATTTTLPPCRTSICWGSNTGVGVLAAIKNQPIAQATTAETTATTKIQNLRQRCGYNDIMLHPYTLLSRHQQEEATTAPWAGPVQQR